MSSEFVSLTFDLSLKSMMTWLFREINGFILDKIRVEGNASNMKMLKSFLGGKITFKGFQIFDSYSGAINFYKNKTTKVFYKK